MSRRASSGEGDDEGAGELARLRSLVDVMPQIVWMTRADGWTTYVNRQWMDFTGLTFEEGLGHGRTALTHPAEQAATAARWEQSTSSGEPYEVECRLRRSDGTYRWMLCRGTPLRDTVGEVVSWYGTYTDIEELKQAQMRTEEQARLLDLAQDAIFVMDLEHRVVYWNKGADRVYGWTPAAAMGRGLDELISPDRKQIDAALAAVRERGEWHGELEGTDTSGSTRLVESRWTLLRNADSSPKGVLVVNTDVTDRRATEATFIQMLEIEATQDPLTGLPNRALLADRLEGAVAVSQRDVTPLAVLFIDLDDFKDINDGSGHLLGDLVLVEVGARIESALRDCDTVARFGGDEFVVLLPNTDEVAATAIADRLLVAIREPMDVERRRLYVSASIGVAVSPPVEPAALLRSADAALYNAKAHGRAQVSMFVAELTRRAEERLELSGDLQHALEHDRITLVHQPIVDLVSGEVMGVEALARWQHRTRGAVPPDVFVTVAEETGLARWFDAQILRRACAEMSDLLRTAAVPWGSYISVNITASSVTDPDFPDVVRRALSAAHVPPASLVIEVTETGVMLDVDAGIRTLAALRAQGVGVAIDDFGTGWSSLTYLKRLPASILKLDQSFVARLHEDVGDRAIAAFVIGLGQATGMTIVAEGVETTEQLDVLRQLGCAAGQGYLWHHAVPAVDLAGALRRVRHV